jgi:thiopeptide-type bacteriocin biosynthesis protein
VTLTPAEQPHAARWFALHLFLADAAQADRFLIEWVAPRVRRLRSEQHASAWFFLRYWEGGPHLRLRLRDLAPHLQAALLADAQASIGPYVSAKPSQRDAYYAGHFFDGQPLDAATLPWWDEGSVAVMPYDPEWRRYGGAAGLLVNEQLFETTSQLALRLVAAISPQAGRGQLAAAHMLPFALAFGGSAEGAHRFLVDYAKYWRMAGGAQLSSEPALAAPSRVQIAAIERQLNGELGVSQQLLALALHGAQQQWDQLQAAGGLQSPITGHVVADVLDAQRTRQAMLASQLHMFNNRLGLTPAQEVLLSRQLAATLAQLLAPSEAA